MKTTIFLFIPVLLFGQIQFFGPNNEQVVNSKVAETRTETLYASQFDLMVVDENEIPILIDTTSTRNWYLARESRYIYGIRNPARNDGTAYQDTLLLDFQLPTEFSTQDTISFWVHGWTQLVGSTDRNSFVVKAYEIAKNNSIGSDLCRTDSVVFAEGASYASAAGRENKILATGLGPNDRLRFIVISRLMGTATELYQDITSLYLTYTRRVY